MNEFDANKLNMHEWLSGGASPCQGEGRGFESRLVLNRNRKHYVCGFLLFPTLIVNWNGYII